MSFFGGATSNGVCSVAFVTKLGDDKVIKGWLKACFGTNTGAEVVGLWSLLLCAKYWGIKYL